MVIIKLILLYYYFTGLEPYHAGEVMKIFLFHTLLNYSTSGHAYSL